MYAFDKPTHQKIDQKTKSQLHRCLFKQLNCEFSLLLIVKFCTRQTIKKSTFNSAYFILSRRVIMLHQATSFFLFKIRENSILLVLVNIVSVGIISGWCFVVFSIKYQWIVFNAANLFIVKSMAFSALLLLNYNTTTTYFLLQFYWYCVCF